jgi:diadenosine tetraphosphatase ApaH/serine/threonine PP2A family protein phosphatase
LPLQLIRPPCFLVHASADAPAAWRYVNNPLVAADSLAHAVREEGVCYVLGGHVHLQALYYQGRGSTLMLFEPVPGKAIPVPQHRRWLATVGSVGQPRDGNRAAAFAMLDTQAAQITFHRVPYDVGAMVALARRKGLPQEAVQRLERAR